MKPVIRISEIFKYEESTLRAAASVLLRRLISQGMKAEDAAKLMCSELEQHPINEHNTDMECVNISK